MADRLDFEIDVELEAGLITGHAGVPGLIEAFRQTGAPARAREGSVFRKCCGGTPQVDERLDHSITRDAAEHRNFHRRALAVRHGLAPMQKGQLGHLTAVHLRCAMGWPRCARAS